MSDTEKFFNWRSALKQIEQKFEQYEKAQPVPRILFIDNDESDIIIFSNKLSKFIQDTTYCRDAHEAQRLISSDTHWDFIFVDYRMPKLSGLEILDSVKPIPPDTQIYVISGTAPLELKNIGRAFVPKDAVTETFLGTFLRPRHE